ncbi:MAG: hypothetical protein QOI94_1390, partial [Acidobacteriaceae bacterium]|nr:hypothetical protein [Acidobacteriaceae bacterium]
RLSARTEKSVPQGLKPSSIGFLCGTAEAVPSSFYIFGASPGLLTHSRIAPKAVRYDVHFLSGPRAATAVCSEKSRRDDLIIAQYGSAHTSCTG